MSFARSHSSLPSIRFFKRAQRSNRQISASQAISFVFLTPLTFQPELTSFCWFPAPTPNNPSGTLCWRSGEPGLLHQPISCSFSDLGDFIFPAQACPSAMHTTELGLGQQLLRSSSLSVTLSPHPNQELPLIIITLDPWRTTSKAQCSALKNSTLLAERDSH